MQRKLSDAATTRTMANKKAGSTWAPATAIITGSFLSGAMIGLSLMTIPLFLDTNTQSAHMLTQWVRLYHYGHLLLPSMAIATSLIHGYTATGKRASGQPWIVYAVAGAVTVSMVPFTLLVMAPTNNTLFRLEDESRFGVAVTTLDHVRELVGRWGRMHLVRSMFPLVGAVIGFRGLLSDLGA